MISAKTMQDLKVTIIALVIVGFFAAVLWTVYEGFQIIGAEAERGAH